MACYLTWQVKGVISGGRMATGEQQQQSQEGKAASIKNCDDTKLSAFNDLLHKPYFSDCFYYLFWVAFWFVTPAFALTGLIGMAIYDIFHIKGFRKPEDEAAILITGCDSGFGQACAKDLAALGWKVSFQLLMCKVYCLSSDPCPSP